MVAYLHEFFKNFFPDNPLQGTLIIIVTIFVMWMYKEIRSNFLEKSKNEISKIEKAIEIYSEVDIELLKFKNGLIDSVQLEEKLTRIMSIIPLTIFNKINTWRDNEPLLWNDSIYVIQQEVRKEINRLKKMQNDIVTYKEPEGIADFIGNYYTTKLASFIIPFLHTLINLVLLMILLFLFALLNQESSTQENILIATMIFSSILYFVIIDLIVSLVILKKRFKHTPTNWILFGLFILFPIIFLYFINVWYKGIILIIVFFLYAIYASRKSIKD